MGKADQLQSLMARSRRMPALILVSMLAGLALAIFLTARYLRENTRAQIISRDGEILTAVARMQADAITEELGEPDILSEAWVQQMVLLESSRLAGVLGTRLFDAEGRFVETFPPQVLEARLDPQDLPSMQALRPVGHYHPSMPLHDLFFPDSAPASRESRGQPILLVNVPLHTSQNPSLRGVAQFILQGQTIAAQFRRLDWNLFSVGLVVFLVTGLFLSLVTGWLFRRLRTTNRLLAERTRRLVEANQELALAAKTSAVGALTSHLIHGLKNPLSGLHHFVNSLEAGNGPAHSPDRQDAVDSTRRMQSLISQVVSVLREQETDHQYEVTMSEMTDVLRTNLDPMAKDQQVRWEVRLETDQALENRTSSLVTLILMNLLQNALQATPAGKSVTLTARQDGTDLVWEVSDQGPGFPEDIRPSLFQPCRSTREGGSGIGLALSKQLATHLGAALDLAKSSAQGCRFELRLPGRRDPPS